MRPLMPRGGRLRLSDFAASSSKRLSRCLGSGAIAPRVLNAVPNRQPHDEVEDHHRDDPQEQEDRFEPRDVHAWTIEAGRARRPEVPPVACSLPLPMRQHRHVTSRENQAQFYWQSSAAGLLLGMTLGVLTGIAVAIYLSAGTFTEYVSILLALPLLGVLVGAICGGAAGIAGSSRTRV